MTAARLPGSELQRQRAGDHKIRQCPESTTKHKKTQTTAPREVSQGSVESDIQKLTYKQYSPVEILHVQKQTQTIWIQGKSSTGVISQQLLYKLFPLFRRFRQSLIYIANMNK